MTVKDLEQKRDSLTMREGKDKDLVEAVYNVGIAIVEALNADVVYEGSMFDKVFGKR